MPIDLDPPLNDVPPSENTDMIEPASLFEEDSALQIGLNEIELEIWENERKVFGLWRPTRHMLDRPNLSDAHGQPTLAMNETPPTAGYRWTVSIS